MLSFINRDYGNKNIIWLQTFLNKRGKSCPSRNPAKGLCHFNVF